MVDAPTEKLAPPTTCQKCGNADQTKYNTTFIKPNQEEGKDFEHIALTCNQCGFLKDVLPMDAQA